MIKLILKIINCYKDKYKYNNSDFICNTIRNQNFKMYHNYINFKTGGRNV